MSLSSRSTRWVQLLRKELVHQLRFNRHRIGVLILLALVLSGASALLLWRTHRDDLIHQNNDEIQTSLGLLELRVNQHRTTVLDWGHWDSMVAFAEGRDPGFVARELDPSSIVQDRQVLIALNRQGRQLILKSEPGSPLAPSLLACIRQRLRVLQRLTPGARSSDAFGLFCQVGGDVVIGAGTGIRPSDGSVPEHGWLVHFSRLERPSYNEGLNRAFHQINRLIEHRQPGQPDSAQPVAALSELLPLGEHFVLLPSLSPFEVARRAAALTIPSWLVINLVLLSLFPVGLLLTRQRRLTGRIRAWQEVQVERKRRHRISRVLMSRRHLLMAFTSDPLPLHGSWIAAIRLAPFPGHGVSAAKATLRERSFQSLVLALSAELQPQLMGLMDPETLLLAFQPGGPPPAAALQTLSRIVQHAEPSAAPGSGCVCCVAPLQPAGQVQQVLNLCLAVGQLAPGQTIEFLRGGVSDRPLPSQRTASATVAPPLFSPSAGLVLMEPVIELRAEERRVLYREVVFAAGAASADAALDPPREPQPSHPMDLYLIRQALAQLPPSSGDSAGQDVGVRLSQASLASPEHFRAVIELLQAAPLLQRRRLVLELNETALMSESALRADQIRQLRELALRIAVTDFGAGHVPIQPLFALKPDFLKLSADYTHELHDENIDSMVDFLVSYCRYKHCTFVLKGVDSRRQLQHWLRKGATVFQGPFLGGSSRPSALRSRPEP